MGRSNGYRPKAAVRQQVAKWRAKLAECTDDQWVKAQNIMDHITALVGIGAGPMNGKIIPRACRYCAYYGHTRQWCKKRIADVAAREAREAEAMLRQDEKLIELYRNKPKPKPYDPTRSGQARTFDELGIPYTIDPDLGPMVGVRGGAHDGKWTFGGNGEVVLRG